LTNYSSRTILGFFYTSLDSSLDVTDLALKESHLQHAWVNAVETENTRLEGNIEDAIALYKKLEGLENAFRELKDELLAGEIRVDTNRHIIQNKVLYKWGYLNDKTHVLDKEIKLTEEFIGSTKSSKEGILILRYAMGSAKDQLRKFKRNHLAPFTDRGGVVVTPNLRNVVSNYGKG
jgi:hypothetical protein